MSETKEVFSIDKLGAYKTRSGSIVDIVEVNQYAAGWYRQEIDPHQVRAWNRNGIYCNGAGVSDIVSAIPFVVDGPGRYMMRDGRVAMVDQMDRQNSVGGQRIGGWYKSHADSQKTDTSWHVNGAWHAIKGTDNDRDLIRKMHPLEQQPGAKAPEAPKVPETQAPLNNHVFRITEPGVYCTRNGRVVNIHEVTPTTANGHWKVSGHKREWLLNGRKHTYIDLGSDIVMKAPPADGVLKITDVVTRLRTDWDRRLAEREEQARKKSMGTKTPKTPPPVHLVVPGIEGKPTQQPSEEQLKLAYQDPPKPVTAKKPTVAIAQTGKYRTRDGRCVTITHVAEAGALGFHQDEGDIARWMLDGRHNEHCETEEDIVEKVEQENPEPKKPSAEAQAALSKALSQKTAEPKKPSAGFDVVIIKSNDGAWTQIVAGGYSEHNGVVTVNPADAHESYMTSKRPGALILKKGDFVRCPTHNVTCVIHYGGEE